MIVYHPARTSFREVLKKSFRVGIGSAQLGHQYPERYGHLATVNPIRLSIRVIRRFLRNPDDSNDCTQEGTQTDESPKPPISQRIVFLAIGFLSNVLYVLGRVRGVYTFQRTHK